jgi:hypothetical protein
MSTSIIQYDKEGNENFQYRALKLYLAITLPLMFVTFASWYGMAWWVDRREKAEREKKE